MNYKFSELLKINRRKFAAFAILFVVTLAGAAVTNSRNLVKESHAFTKQEIKTAEFPAESEYKLKIEQDFDAKFSILEAKVKIISGADYQLLTSENTSLSELASVPEITLKNMSDKPIKSFTLIINDKGAKTNRGLFIKEQFIEPGQIFIVKPENFVGASENPASNPKFWLATKDKSQVVVRVVATFADGSKWFNKNFGGV